MRVKICGVTTPADAVAAADAGADALGLNFYPRSPRYLEPSAARAVVAALPPFTACVGVFVGTPMRQAAAMAYQLGLQAIQDYADQPPSEDPFPFAHIPAFRVKDEQSLADVRQFLAVAQQRHRRPAAVLIDSFVAGEMGGTGHRAPWHLLSEHQLDVPLILAGGLTPENVAEAIHQVRPWGVDVASGVESAPGRKDLGKVRAFIAAAKAAGSQLAR